MSERPTPETDTFAIKFKTTCGEKYWVPVDIARKLQRELAEAREALEYITEYGTEEINAAVSLRQKLARALVDLDNMQDQRDLAMKVIKRLEQERDDVREVFREMWQSGDAFLPYIDEETTNRWRKAAGWEKTK